MQLAVWKYPFDLKDEVVLLIPGGSKVLHIAMQGLIPCMWVLVDPERTKKEFRFKIFGTGVPIEQESMGFHVGSFFMDGGQFIWHVFQLP